MVKFLDCTLRDGGYSTNWNFSDEYVYKLMSVLNRHKISFFEIGYRNFYENSGKGPFYYCTPELIKQYYEKKCDLSLGVMVDAKRFNESDFKNGNNDYVDFVRIAVHPEKIKESLDIAELLFERDYNVMIQLMEMSELTKKEYKILESWNRKDIIKTLYLADTYGIINSEELKRQYTNVKSLGYKNISFHAHNKTNQALSNSILAISLGAFSIDVIQENAGINGGNLLYNSIVGILQEAK